jgi:hypothetical protein
MFSNHEYSPEELLKLADKEMYKKNTAATVYASQYLRGDVV